MALFAKYKTDFKLNFRLAFPIMAGQLGQVTVNLADNVMVGRLGAESLAAVSVANAIFIIFLVVGMGISFALPTLISEADGAHEHRKISQYFKHSLVINIGFSFIALLMILITIPLLYHLGQDEGVVRKAIPYLKITAWSSIPLMIFQTFRCYSDGMSKTLLPMYAIIFGNVINIILNYGLIFGKLGLPEMGVSGAALASFLARICMILLLIWVLFHHKSLWEHIRKADYKKYQKKLFLQNLSIGIPISLQGFFEVSAFAGAALIMGMVSKEAQAAHQIAINLASVTFLMVTGLAMAATIRVGNQLGKKDYPKLRIAGLSAIFQVVLIMSCTAIIFIIFRDFLPSLYINDDYVIGLASTLLIMAAIFQIPDGIQVTTLGALRGLQDVKVPTLITFISYWIFGIPISYLAAFNLGLEHIGVWIGLIVGLSISSILLSIRFNKKTRSLIEESNL